MVETRVPDCLVEVWHLEQARWDSAKRKEWRMPPRHSIPLELAISNIVAGPDLVPRLRHRLVAGPDGFKKMDIERNQQSKGIKGGSFLNQQRF